jgi:hypothetical protein
MGMSRNLDPGTVNQLYGSMALSHRHDFFNPSYSTTSGLIPPYQSISSTEMSNLAEEEADILGKIRGKDLWIVNSRRRNGLILHKEFYTEFAGPGAAIGGNLDADCRGVIALGSLSLIAPDSPEEQQKALRIRLQWVRLTQNFTDKPVSIDRARMILEQFKSYFDQTIVDQVPDEAFALMVGVLPCTISRARSLM